jgi:hypothetical protein
MTMANGFVRWAKLYVDGELRRFAEGVGKALAQNNAELRAEHRALADRIAALEAERKAADGVTVLDIKRRDAA